MGCLLCILSDKDNANCINYSNYYILVFFLNSLFVLKYLFITKIFLVNTNATDKILASANVNP